jgi:hypothetical protein
MIAVAESFVIGKAPRASSCQDAIEVTDRHAAVIDGTTTVDPCTCCGSSAGGRAAAVVANAVRDLPADAALATFLKRAEEELVLATRGLPCGGQGWSASAAVFSAVRREVWVVGDVGVAIDGRFAAHRKAIDEVSARARAAVLRAASLDGVPDRTLLAEDPGRRAILPLLRAQQSFRNRTAAGELAYAVLAPERTPLELCTVDDVPAGARTLVLATDGYPAIRRDLAATESHLQELLDADPLCCRINVQTKGVRPGNRSFDDRAYLRLSLSRA